MTIKAWDSVGQPIWKCIQVYGDHTHCIVNFTFNPKDTSAFASGSYSQDTVPCVSHANFTMDPYDKGVNSVDFYLCADKPYLVMTGDDDGTTKVWDYPSKSCVQTMEGHTNNILFAIFHPKLLIILSGSEDGTVGIWNSNTYRLENMSRYALEQAWCVSSRKAANERIVIIKLGRNELTYSLDPSGKLIAQSSFIGHVQTLSDDTTTRFPSRSKTLVVGDGKYIIYTAVAGRNKLFGSGVSFA